jgi:hypothetical protein
MRRAFSGPILLFAIVSLFGCTPTGQITDAPEPAELVAVPGIELGWLAERAARLGSTGAEVKWRPWTRADGKPAWIEVRYSNPNDATRAANICQRVSGPSKGSVVRKIGGSATVTVVLSATDPGSPPAGTANCLPG